MERLSENFRISLRNSSTKTSIFKLNLAGGLLLVQALISSFHIIIDTVLFVSPEYFKNHDALCDLSVIYFIPAIAKHFSINYYTTTSAEQEIHAASFNNLP